VLGEFGAVAVRAAMLRAGLTGVPSIRTIGRIFERRGVLDGNKRVRRPPPPLGWYLPAVANGGSEVDSFDVVTGLVIRGGTHIEILNGVSLVGGLIASWCSRGVTARFAAAKIVEHWRTVGLPDFAQFDNDTRFQGAHQHPGVVSTVMRVCLLLGVTPVFAPPQETGFQAAIESLNGRWQAKVWSRFEHSSLEDLQRRSDSYVAAHRARSAQRAERASRRPFPPNFTVDLQRPPRGKLVYLRRLDDRGVASLLGERFSVTPDWAHRLVRAEVNLDEKLVRFFRLRRRAPDSQPLIAERRYELPARRRAFNSWHRRNVPDVLTHGD
jgi:hypothetical protein